MVRQFLEFMNGQRTVVVVEVVVKKENLAVAKHIIMSVIIVIMIGQIAIILQQMVTSFLQKVVQKVNKKEGIVLPQVVHNI